MMCCYLPEFLVVLISISVIVCFKVLTPERSEERRLVFGIYRTRKPTFYWPKVAFIYIILTLRKWRVKRKQISINDEEIDRPQKLSHDNKAVDAVYFNAANENGDHLITGMARRKNRLVDGFLYLKIEKSKLGVLQIPTLPDTSLYQTEEAQEHSAGGIKIVPVVPMKKWRIEYQGKMRRAEEPEESLDVEMEMNWTAEVPYFHFDDMDDLARAKAIALEPWTREYFQALEKAHQTHYEQFGELKGTIKINQTDEYNISLNSVRDHSYGRREWRLIHKYVLHFLSTENGDRFNLGMMCMPTLFSGLPLGYVYSAKDETYHPIQSCDMQLYQFGDKSPPKDYAFTAYAGGKAYTVKVDIKDSPAFYISKDWELKIVEGLCNVEINGLKGWGCAEWGYRNIEGRAFTC